MILNGVKHDFELDAGSPVTIISKAVYDSLRLRCTIIPCPEVRFCSYDQESIQPTGYIRVTVTYKKKTSLEEMFIVSENFASILGRLWIRKLNILGLNTFHNLQDDNLNIDAIDTKSAICEQFPDVFKQKVGCIPNVQCTLKLKESTTPVYRPPHPISYALKLKVDIELHTLEKQDIIEKN